jgi:hypothetical protein
LNRTIEIIVSPQGETKLETKGFSGSSCREASRLLELALGTKANEQLTPEFYTEAKAAQQVQQGGAG